MRVRPPWRSRRACPERRVRGILGAVANGPKPRRAMPHRPPPTARRKGAIHRAHPLISRAGGRHLAPHGARRTDPPCAQWPPCGVGMPKGFRRRSAPPCGSAHSQNPRTLPSLPRSPKIATERPPARTINERPIFSPPCNNLPFSASWTANRIDWLGKSGTIVEVCSRAGVGYTTYSRKRPPIRRAYSRKD